MLNEIAVTGAKRMAWKFWQKSKPPAVAKSFAAIDWDTDAYESVKFLFGMYVKDAPPFSEWRDQDASLLPEIEELSSTNVKAYQLCLWFAMYRRQRGAIEATMLRDSFIQLFGVVSPDTDLGSQVRWLLDFQDKAMESVQDIPNEKKVAVDEAMGTEMPPEYYIAMYQLLAYPDSPYGPEKQDLREDQQRTLCVCLLNGNIRAREVFGPMLEAIKTFDPSKIPSWEWSTTMGAYERHLKRRNNNPLFSPARRAVTTTDVYQARLLDTKAHDQALEELDVIRQELRDTELPYTWFEYLDDKRQQIDAIQDRVAAMDRCGDDLKPLAERIRSTVVGIMQDVLKENDPERAALIYEAEDLRARTKVVFASDWVQQIRHPDNIIPPEEVVPALLSEDVDSLAAIVKTMEQEEDLHESLAHTRTESLDVVRKARADGHELPGIEDKLRVLGIVL